MRLGALLLSVMLLSSVMFAQKRYVVSSGGDMLLIPKGKSAAEVIHRQEKNKSTFGTAAACVPSREYGNLPAYHTTGSGVRFFFGHKDVIACWFETPAAGTIDSVYIRVNEQIGDTLTTGGKLYLRIHKSLVHSGSGPGWSPYVAPPKVCWGYFNNTFDLDAGLAAFPDDASNPAWVSTYALNNTADAVTAHYGELVDTTLTSFAPAGDEIWGSGGVEVAIKLNSINGMSLATLGKPEVALGDPIFINFRVPGAGTTSGHPVDSGTNPPFTEAEAVVLLSRQDEIYGDDTGGGNPDPTVRRTATNWKFYEHASFCGPGWLARGGVTIFMWYVMSVTSDVAPTFTSIDNLGYTTQQTGVRTVQAEIEDCNFADPGQAGVASATLYYQVDSSAVQSVPMTFLGGTIYTADIPAQTCGTRVRYYLTATDVKGNLATSGLMIYKTLCLRNNSYVADTATTRSFEGNIRTLGTAIDTSAFHSPHIFNLGTAGSTPVVSKDDGTAGPFAISNGFIYFGDTMHYAWVGINGAIALSKTATDTIDVNSNGSYGSFDLPATVRRAYPDTTFNSGAPRNFIAAMWADLIVGDTVTKYGNIYHYDTADQFIVEWDSAGTFNSEGSLPDEAIFRVVLNKSNGVIEFQYDNVGNNGIDSAAVVGIQSDSTNPGQTPGFLLLNRYIGPIETKPRNDWAVALWPVAPVAIADGWNMISVPGSSWNYSKSALFGAATSPAFAYQGGYVQQTDLVNGPGYWLKFTGAQTAQVAAGYHTSQDVALTVKWNMIGSVTSPVAKSSLTTDPSGLINTGQIFAYSNGYTNASSTIDPGKGYWVKATANGTLHLNAAAGTVAKSTPVADTYADMNQITVQAGQGRQDLYLANAASLKQTLDVYELPPVAPEGAFDARFSSGRMVESFQANTDASYRIDIQAQQYPVTISWKINQQPEGRTFVMTDADNGKVLGKVILQGQGSIRIENSAVKSVLLTAESGINVPKTFALSQNYPNPFNPVTRMQLDVPQAGQVTMAIYDLLGRKVATLVDGVTEAGYHTIEWNGRDGQGMSVPSGTYFVRVNAGEFSSVKKIMLMK